MSRLTENIVLFMVGLALAMIAASGSYTNYVKPSLLPWLVGAALLVLVMAVTALATDVRRGTDGHADATHLDDGHHHSSAIGWLLVLPVVALIFVPAPALSSPTSELSVQQPAINVDRGIARRHAFPPLPPGRAPALYITEASLRARYDTAGTLTGRLVTIVGFTIKPKTGDEVDIGRFYAICCAADARLHRLRLDGPAAAQAAEFPKETWLRVEGWITPEADPKMPIRLTVSQLSQVPQPADPYEYPG